MVKKSPSAVKRIGERFEIKGSVNRKVNSVRPRASTIKDNHRLQMTVLTDSKKTFVGHRIYFVFTTFLIIIPFSSLFWVLSIQKKIFFLLLRIFCYVQQIFSYTLQNSCFKPVVVLCCGSSGVTRTNFPVHCAFSFKHFPNYFYS